jgi:hypothetical protein
MKRSIDQSRKSSEAQLRAYLSVDTQASDPACIKQFGDTLAQGVYLLFVENTGQTPAYDVECFSTWTSFAGDATEWPENVRFLTVKELSAKDDVRGLLGTKLVLGAGHRSAYRCAAFTQKDGMTFTAALQNVAEHKITVFIYGTITYRHAFSKEPVFTEFCVRPFMREETATKIEIGYSGYHRHHTAT